ncbi:MAG: DNA primase [Chloroherpetonaceae bacterium]|nr:DNA primase [Chloroherpetonaceae bacterium]MCS7210126.1 DNA primase [Chloroherpetonaceae bacterium]MDW8019882.1 DNA primase [Chloroherpetonaceae bacterium]
MRLPEEKIEEIRRLADIVDVVSEYVPLQPAGRNYKARSPFTNERTPSFFVSPEKQIYKCFSSGKGGNVFTFVMEMEKVGFLDAVKIVAKKVGIDLSQYEKGSDAAEKEQIEYAVMRFAARFFHQALNTAEGKVCLEYFKSRGLTRETISHFGLGYAYNHWDKLIEAAQSENFSVDLLRTLGLASYSEKSGKHYDTFRHRAMFPIFSTAGKVVGFAGRLLEDEKDAPKYINSPESPLYEKSKLLYALNFAKDDIRRKGEAILVEGYMDAISLHQAGICNCVASSGTALTTEQVKLLSRYSRNILFLYDGDRAGLSAMQRGIDTMLEQGMTPFVVILPDGHDPDSFVREAGAESLRQFITAHRFSFLDFKIQMLKESGALSDPVQFRRSLSELVATLLKLPDELAQEIYFKALSEKLDISLALLRNEAESQQAEKRRKRLAPKLSVSPAVQQAAAQHIAPAKPSQAKEVLSVVERTFLKALLESTAHGSAALEFTAEYLSLLNLQHPQVQATVAFILRRYEQLKARGLNTLDVPSELAYLEDESLRNFISELLIETPISERWPEESATHHARRCLQAFLDATSRLMMAQCDHLLKENLAKLQHTLDEAEQVRLLEEQKRILERRQEIRREFEAISKNWGC